jgi:hypothetical protein
VAGAGMVCDNDVDTLRSRKSLEDEEEEEVTVKKKRTKEILRWIELEAKHS